MIKRVAFPGSTLLNPKDFHYHDCFQGTFNDKNDEVTITELGKAFFAPPPKWISVLFNIRNKLVAKIGLKIPDRKMGENIEHLSFEPSQQVGFFKVLSKTEDEILFGEDDKHLNFKVSLLQERDPQDNGIKRLTCSTVVKYNNWLGRVYFFIVKPFHQMVVPSMMKRMIKEIDRL